MPLFIQEQNEHMELFSIHSSALFIKASDS